MSGAKALLADGVVVVGTGLIGTSVGLALRAAGVPVHLEDADERRAALSAELGAGTRDVALAPALVVVCVPPDQVGLVTLEVQWRYLQASVTDVASVKSHVQQDIESRGADLGRFVGGHPMAGRERSGASVARADLFEGRPWVLSPSRETSPLTRARAAAVAELCGADVVVVDPVRHDAAVALVSHLPQVVASAVAARLADAEEDLVVLAGQGVRDVTRIAASDAALWTEILTANASAVLPLLDALLIDLGAVRASLRAAAGGPGQETDSRSAAVVTDFLERGARGRSRLPGKHGGRPASYVAVPVVVTDEPGQLARLFAAADLAGVNVEDVTIEHAAGHPVGVVELLVRPELAVRLADALRAAGWSVHG